jgi:hypothetical protein
MIRSTRPGGSTRRSLHCCSNASAKWAGDELILDWRTGAPEGTEVRIFIPDWDADTVVDLADRFYLRHAIRKVDDHTVALPGGGVRYVPVPPTTERYTGVIEANFPLCVKKGQRYDLAVRQISNRGRASNEPAPEARRITRDEAAQLLANSNHPPAGKGRKGDDKTLPIGAFDLGDNRVLITDLRLIDDAGDHAILVQHPDPKTVAAARKDSGYWRETIGAFQLGVPVSTKQDMLAHHLRLLSALRWRADLLRPDSRWYRTFIRYVELIATKVAALGGDPWSVAPSPDGSIEVPGTCHDPDDELNHDRFNDVDSPDGRVGKISGLLFDHFGDFEGFVLEDHAGTSQSFFSSEPAIGDLARAAWRERQKVRVITVSASSRKVRRLVIGGPPY